MKFLFIQTKKFDQSQYKVKEAGKAELETLFGLLYLAGYYKSGRQNEKIYG
jgi:hypothetical protein